MVFSGDGDHEILGMVDDGSFGKFIYICKLSLKKSMCNFQLLFNFCIVQICLHIFLFLFYLCPYHYFDFIHQSTSD